MDNKYSIEEEIAISRYENGEQYSCSSFIDEDTIIAGYGEIEDYDFVYPLPPEYIIKIYGTSSWLVRMNMDKKETNE